ncbi:MAG: hypothetical protein HOV79_21435 [Hamadaea sp.]|nr:hypothetical protein [Hamadaea sp.]
MRWYRLTPVPGLPGDPEGSGSPRAINGGGEIAGSIGPRVARWDADLTPHVLTFPGTYAFATGINASGSIAVNVDEDGKPRRAFAYHAGAVVDISAKLPAVASTAEDVNDAGVVVGTVTTASGDRPYLYQLTTGVVTLLPPLPGHDSAAGVAINNLGHVVGGSRKGDKGRAVLWRNGAVIDLGTAVSYVDVNDADLVVGHRDDPQRVWVPCWADASGTTVPTVVDIAAKADSATAVNNKGAVIGAGVVGAIPVQAFVHLPPGEDEPGTILLAGRVEDFPDLKIQRLRDVNDAGLIVGGADGVGGFVLRPYDRLPDVEEDLKTLVLLFGAAINDGGGWGLLAGGGRVPIPPHEWNQLSQTEKEQYVAAAVRDLQR